MPVVFVVVCVVVGWLISAFAGAIAAVAVLLVLLAAEYGRRDHERDPLIPILASGFVFGVLCALVSGARLGVWFI